MVEDVTGLAVSEGPAWQFGKEVGKTIAIDLIYEGLKSVDWRKALSNPTGYPRTEPLYRDVVTCEADAASAPGNTDSESHGRTRTGDSR
jgi:hypothetical protein